MYDIEKIANSLAAKIATILNHDKDYEEVIAYGAYSILQTLNTILFILLFGFLFKVPLEAFIISFASSILRKYSGGVHASTSNRCAIVGVAVFVSLAIVVNFLSKISLATNLYIILGCFGVSYFIISKNAPKDTPNKPLTNPEVRKDLRRKSLRVIHVFLLMTGILIFLYYKGFYNYGLSIILSISFGTLWQSFTLTYIGNLIVSNLDRLLGELAFKIGGEN